MHIVLMQYESVVFVVSLMCGIWLCDDGKLELGRGN